jgi:hypothetical protein
VSRSPHDAEPCAARHARQVAGGAAAGSGLGGTGRVADDLWLMAHHETSGRPFLGSRPLGIGVAGGCWPS